MEVGENLLDHHGVLNAGDVPVPLHHDLYVSMSKTRSGRAARKHPFPDGMAVDVG